MTVKLNQEQITPWEPESDRLTLKILGKQLEELNELGSATARCVIQGINGREPVTKKPNSEWFMEEIADVYATTSLAIEHLGLDIEPIKARVEAKRQRLLSWHEM